ncbi:MAG: hypothetical protein Q4C82_06600 [Eubacteriales bacterium]|nr:hypothetical protein [Eubacteriales bacterium]
MQKTYESCRKDYPVFYYTDYEAAQTEDGLSVTYHFDVPGLSSFAPSWRFPLPASAPAGLTEDRTLRKLLFSLGMVELVSYWKIACPPEVLVQAGALDEEQLRWWKKLYYQGLGEFFYTNGIDADPDTFMTLTAEGTLPAGEDRPASALSGCLIPVGGGKDSACTIELLKKSGQPLYSYIINPRGATLATVDAAGLPSDRSVHVRRTLDSRMLDLNRQGFLNGHTPFSALVAFSSVITAYLYGLKYVALSNESSANESTVVGSSVNHQYSKSFEFERDFHEYEKRFIGSGVYYFSMLRPLSEFQIASYFAGMPAYHDIFRSCNAGSKQDVWCGHCPKCLFVFLILSPFLSHKRLAEIFGADMLNDETMADCFEKLIGLQNEKPFECVGSVSEVNAAVCLTIERMERDGEPLPLLFSRYKELPLFAESFPRRRDYERYYDREHLLPESFLKLLADECYGGNLPC